MLFQEQVIKSYQSILEWYLNEDYHGKTILVESCEITALLVFTRNLTLKGLMNKDEYDQVESLISKEPFSNRHYEYILLNADYNVNKNRIKEREENCINGERSGETLYYTSEKLTELSKSFDYLKDQLVKNYVNYKEFDSNKEKEILAKEVDDYLLKSNNKR